MSSQNIVIRRETENDRRAVENLVRESLFNNFLAKSANFATFLVF